MYRHLFLIGAARSARLRLLGAGICALVAGFAALALGGGALTTPRPAAAAPAVRVAAPGPGAPGYHPRPAQPPRRGHIPLGLPADAPPFAGFASAGIAPRTIITNNWTNLFPGLTAVSAVSSTEAWAAGEDGHLLHYIGGSWQSVDPANLRGLSLNDLQMLSPTSGWLTAYDHAFVYDGTNWNERSAGLHDPQTGIYLQLSRIRALAAGNVWALTYYDNSNNNTYGPALAHWDGTSWGLGSAVLSDTVNLAGLTFAAPNDGWAAGDNYDQGSQTDSAVLLHYNGSGWTAFPPPAGARGLGGAWAVGPSDVWMTGYDNTGRNIYHYQSGTWISTTLASRIYPRDDLLMRNDSEGWVSASGYNGNNTILHWDGHTWTPEYTGRTTVSLAGAAGQVWAVGPADSVLSRPGAGPWLTQQGGPTTNGLYGVAAVSTAEAWAVGAYGTILHYTGGAWQTFPISTTASLYALQMLSPADGYAVGSGAVLHWDGTAWTQVATPSATLYGLYMLGPGNGWAVGANAGGGVIWHAVGGVWSVVATPPVDWLYGVAFDSPTHGWAVGGNPYQQNASGMLLEYNGTSWTDQRALLPAGTPALRSILLTPGGGWATVASFFTGSSSPPAILHLSGRTWNFDPTVPSSYLTALAPEALGEAWATGSDTFHYVGGAWQQVSLPTNEDQEGIALVPGRGGWSVSYGGEILQYNPLGPGQRFYDVPLSNPFAPFIEYMVAHNIVSGYGDNTFHPYSNITRAQLTKMVVNGLAWPPVSPAAPTFADVPTTHPFYSMVETAAAHAVISGYTCGGPGEPCDAQHRPYFRPGNNVTRAQLAKIIVGAKGWGPANPPTPTFADVPASSPFYGVVEQAAAHGIISGYGCGGPGEPCPGTYFRPANSATRGQLSKILYLALTGP